MSEFDLSREELTDSEMSNYQSRISTCPDPKLAFTKADGSLSKPYLFIDTKGLLQAQILKSAEYHRR
jgi:hypothetical protein